MTRSAALASLLCLALTVQAKDWSDWNRVSALGKGNDIQVIRKGGAAVRGRFSASSDVAVSLDTGQGTVTVPRDEVAEVGRKGGGKAKWIGAAVGGVAGALVGGAVGTRLANEGQADKGAVAAGVAAGGAGLGFLIGWSFDGQYKPVYRAK